MYMRTALYDGYGNADVIYVAQRPIPTPPAGEVLVKVHALTVNGGELAGRSGKVKLVTGKKFPLTLGIDFVGEVVTGASGSAGPANSGLVWGVLPRTFGSAAEYVSVHPSRFSPAPKNLTATEAATLLAGGTTALTALRDKAHIQPGERLLVRGGSGGVGSLGVQMGKALGAHVTALAGKSSGDFVAALGTDVVLDYRENPITGVGEFDVVLDTVGTGHRSLRKLLAPGGRMVAVSFDLERLVPSLGYIAGSAVFGSRRVRFFSGNPRRDLLAELAAMAESGMLRPVVDTVHTLENISAAHAALEAGGVHGKHVIDVLADPLVTAEAGQAQDK